MWLTKKKTIWKKRQVILERVYNTDQTDAHVKKKKKKSTLSEMSASGGFPSSLFPLFRFHLDSRVVGVQIVFFHVAGSPNLHAVCDLAASRCQDEVVDESRRGTPQKGADPKDLEFNTHTKKG